MPIIRKIYIGNHGLLGVWLINESVEDLLSMIHFSNGDKETFERFKNKSRQAHWLSYRLAARQLLGDPKDLEFYYDEFGKIHFKKHDYSLSVTHSGDYSAVILDSQHCVGIDIERISDRINNVSLKFLSVEELINIDENDNKLLTLLWSAKEALYKLHGIGDLVFDKNIILDQVKEIQQEGMIKGRIIKDEMVKEYNLNYLFIGDYVLVYCVDEANFGQNIE
jgi:4'-phosphopantetheinyl transferase